MKKFTFGLVLAFLVVSGQAGAITQEEALIGSYLFKISIADIEQTEDDVGVNITQTWGENPEEVCGYQGGHAGLDIQTKDVAGTKVASRTFYAISEGVVIAAGTDANHNIAIYDEERDLTTYYLHADTVAVTLGQAIQVGEMLGVQGDWGYSSGEHVHLEVRDGYHTSSSCGASDSLDPEEYFMNYLQYEADPVVIWDSVTSAEAAADYDVIDASGNLAAGSWAYFKITTLSSYNQLAVRLADISSNVYLYVKKNSKPTTVESATVDTATYCVPYTDDNSETCIFDTSGDETWYVGLYAESSGPFTLQVFWYGPNADSDGDTSLAKVSSSAATDGDNDGLTDDEEETWGTDPDDKDSDNDGYQDGFEVIDGTDPTDWDTDDDGVMDGGDICATTVPLNSRDTIDSTGCALSQLDSDRDGESDYVETYGSDEEDDSGLVAEMLTAKLTGLDVEDYSYAGRAVAVSGELAVVGAWGDSSSGTASGAVYVFRWDGSAWNQEQKLMARDAYADDRFGYAVALSGDVIAVGAFYDDTAAPAAGAVYVFRWDGSSWNQEAELVADDAEYQDFLGYSVAIDENRIVAGALGEDTAGDMAGAAYVFVWDGSAWSQQAKLTASDGASGDQLGTSVAISGGSVVAGALGHDGVATQAGAAYVFTLSSGTWSQTQKLTASDAAANDYFANDVAISNSWLAVGAPYKMVDGKASRGGVYLYHWEDDQWQETSLVLASSGLANDYFGYSVAMTETAMIVGAYGRTATSSYGSAYVYQWNGADWDETAEFSPVDTSTQSFFGIDVAISDELAVVGAYADSDSGFSSGAAYVYDLTDSANLYDTPVDGTQELSVDSDGDGVSNADDLCGETIALDISDIVDSTGCALSQKDTDADTLTDYAETYTYGTKPDNADSDNDTLNDADEVNLYATNPLKKDSDGDSLKDAAEILTYGTDPLDTNTDDDGLNDDKEVSLYGTDPLDSDSDDDGLQDGYEVRQSFTNPKLADTDGDGFSDGDEVNLYATDPLTPDDVTVYTVSKTADTKDGSCNSDCSMREAIIAAKANTKTTYSKIEFNIPTSDTGCDASGVCTIKPTSNFPSLTRNYVVIDGYTQSGASSNTKEFPSGLDAAIKIVLDGRSISGGGGTALLIKASFNRVTGLGIQNFWQAIKITGANSSYNKIQGCFLGTDATGMTKQENLHSGVHITGVSTGVGNVIGVDGDGDDEASERNLISGNAYGIRIASTSGTVTVAGNVIGWNADLSDLLGNVSTALQIKSGANVVGSNEDGISDAVEGNIIYDRVYLTSTLAVGNQVRRNAISDYDYFSGTGIKLASNANNGKAEPKIVDAIYDGLALTITGTATPGDAVEVFWATYDDPSKSYFLESKTYLESVTTDALGAWSVTIVTTDVVVGESVVATASDLSNGTSEFSSAKIVE